MHDFRRGYDDMSLVSKTHPCHNSDYAFQCSWPIYPGRSNMEHNHGRFSWRRVIIPFPWTIWWFVGSILDLPGSVGSMVRINGSSPLPSNSLLVIVSLTWNHPLDPKHSSRNSWDIEVGFSPQIYPLCGQGRVFHYGPSSNPFWRATTEVFGNAYIQLTTCLWRHVTSIFNRRDFGRSKHHRHGRDGESNASSSTGSIRSEESWKAPQTHRQCGLYTFRRTQMGSTIAITWIFSWRISEPSTVTVYLDQSILAINILRNLACYCWWLKSCTNDWECP